MNKLLFLSGVVLFFAVATSFTLLTDSENPGPNIKAEKKNELVSFKLKGTGSKGITVKVGVGGKIGQGSCCRSVGPNSTVSFQGHIGDVVYDSERRTVIMKVYNGIQGTTTDLKNYY